MKNKKESIGKFIIIVSGDSSVGDYGYSIEATIPPDSDYDEQDMETWNNYCKEFLLNMYGQEYKTYVYTEEEYDKMISYYTLMDEMENEGD